MERTLVLVKPDGVQRGLIGEIFGRFERRGLKLVGMKFLLMSEELAARHYGEHEGKPFYAGLVDFITSGPVVAMVWEGNDAIAVVRGTMGVTIPARADPGTIRGDYGIEVGRNLVHGSDRSESAAREIELFFDADELIDWSRTIDRWIQE